MKGRKTLIGRAADYHIKNYRRGAIAGWLAGYRAAQRDARRKK